MTSWRRRPLLNSKKHGTAQNRRMNVSCACKNFVNRNKKKAEAGFLHIKVTPFSTPNRAVAAAAAAAAEEEEEDLIRV